MQIMNDWKPLVAETNSQVSLGTAFTQEGKKKQSKGRLPDAEWNALSPEAKSKLVQKRKDDNAKKKAANASGDAKKSSKKDDDDDSSVSSSKSMSELQNENARLKRRLKKTNACLVTTINEGDEEEDLTDDEGSMSFVAAASFMAEMCPNLRKGVLLAMRASTDLKSHILLDSQSTHDVFCNPMLVTNIRKAKRNLVLSTNGGGMKINQEADVIGLYPVGHDNTVYYDVRAITNIVSLKRMCASFRVTYDSEESNTFLVHRSCHGLPDLKFAMSECGLHVCVGPIKGNMFIQCWGGDVWRRPIRWIIAGRRIKRFGNLRMF
jgi:hypothetical protein